MRNFKGFEEESIGLRQLTLLSGPNSSGKSSVIQALVLLRQIDWQRSPNTDHAELLPTGQFLSLGTGRDLLHEYAKTDVLSIGVGMDSGERREWIFDYLPTSGKLISKDVISREDLEFVRALPLTYLAAERWGPRTTYPYEDSEPEGSLGVLGQYTFRHLLDHGDDPVENLSLHHPQALGKGLLHQVAAWLGEISPGVKMDVQALKSVGLASAGFGFDRKGDVASRYYRPANVGFGLSYSISMIVALLCSTKKSLILLENPEAHLHPRGQSSLARLIVRASSLAQVIVETHSDHVMNGIRVAVKRRELSADQVAFHYLVRDGVTSRVQTPTLDSEGRLSFWPEGFFDQHDRDLAALVRRPGTKE
nr:DUF3696 domain-containing protein [Caenimonas aquaedulcis]